MYMLFFETINTQSTYVWYNIHKDQFSYVKKKLKKKGLTSIDS